MADILVFLLLLCVVLTVIGLIRPKVFTRFLRKFATRRSILLGGGVAVLALFIIIGATAPASSTARITPTNVPVSSSASKKSIEKKTPAKIDTTQVKQVTEQQSIPFTSTTVSSSTLPKGQSQVTQAGVNGEQTVTYSVTYTNGQEAGRTQTATTITKQPVQQVTTVGTYVAPAPQSQCSNGTYVNSSGNTVCRPEQSSSAPSGASAQCRDGSYSFSQHRSGTCSGHGGVATWL